MSTGAAFIILDAWSDLLPADGVHMKPSASTSGGIAARTLGIPQVWHARNRLAREYLAGLGSGLAASTLLSYFIANSESTMLTIPQRRGLSNLDASARGRGR